MVGDKKRKVYIKTFEGSDREKIESEVNQFIKDNKVIATVPRTNIVRGDLFYTIFCFNEVWE